MDKKLLSGSRALQQPSPKGALAADSKKNQDVSNGSNKPWPRGRRRDAHGPQPVTTGKTERGDASRRPAAQRNRASGGDKRPRPKGGTPACPSDTLEGGEEAELGDASREAELGSVFKSGSKKQNHNHLLNFRYKPVEGLQGGGNGGGSFHYYYHHHHQQSRSSAGGGCRNFVAKHKYSKEEFLQANCQFVVRECGDYKMYMSNPDALVDWNSIVQINVPVTEFPSCPICLEQPVAAKMTRCGHIYCWTCMLYYLSLLEKKCPICFQDVRKSELRSVVVIPRSRFSVGAPMTFKLMKRARGSLVTYPCDYPVHAGDDEVPLTVSEQNAGGNIVYTKLLLASKTDVISVFERERKEMRRLLAEDEQCRERACIEEAMGLLEQHEKLLYDTNYWNEELKQTKNRGRLVSGSDSSSDEANRERCNSDSSEASDDLAANQNRSDNLNFVHQQIKFHYFYQASDGQHIYLDPLNVRMLEHTYGTLEHCPKTIQGTLLDRAVGSVNEQFRRRYKFLQHLPITCQFELAEIAIGPPLISGVTAEEFRDEVRRRRRERQKRATKEKHREKVIAEDENRRMGRSSTDPIDIRLESHEHFPTFSASLAIAAGSPPLGELELVDEDEGAASLGGECSSVEDASMGGLSFAKMLSSSTNKSSAPTWPILRKTNLPITNNRPTTSKPEDYEDAAPPASSQSIGDFITIALKNAGEAKVRRNKKNKKKRGGRSLMETEDDQFP